ncbi:SAM-dependent methyltransferase [Actinoplanes sp. NPDC020271]|uniref:SAM-dependent methyltransferase n=1 Tax=Actinoplanes sp. NPDC020271 TaxID=3363896 RepID=UPI00379425C9
MRTRSRPRSGSPVTPRRRSTGSSRSCPAPPEIHVCGGECARRPGPPGRPDAGRSPALDHSSPEEVAVAHHMIANGQRGAYRRAHARFSEFFTGLDLVEPGVTIVSDWHSPRARAAASRRPGGPDPRRGWPQTLNFPRVGGRASRPRCPTGREGTARCASSWPESRP